VQHSPIRRHRYLLLQQHTVPAIDCKTTDTQRGVSVYSLATLVARSEMTG